MGNRRWRGKAVNAPAIPTPMRHVEKTYQVDRDVRWHALKVSWEGSAEPMAEPSRLTTQSLLRSAWVAEPIRGIIAWPLTRRQLSDAWYCAGAVALAKWEKVSSRSNCASAELFGDNLTLRLEPRLHPGALRAHETCPYLRFSRRDVPLRCYGRTLHGCGRPAVVRCLGFLSDQVFGGSRNTYSRMSLPPSNGAEPNWVRPSSRWCSSVEQCRCLMCIANQWHPCGGSVALLCSHYGLWRRSTLGYFAQVFPSLLCCD